MEVIPMAEVGLVRFAHVAHEVAEAVSPSYRKYSKHLFTQPALLAILCLMRYEDWTFREAKVRLGEHQSFWRVYESDRLYRLRAAGRTAAPRGGETYSQRAGRPHQDPCHRRHGE
jgi:hypothetical protein